MASLKGNMEDIKIKTISTTIKKNHSSSKNLTT